MSAVKSIKVSEETYRKLARLGTLEDSFDSVISKLIANSEGSGESAEQ
jgi:predicted CopG family antitoxin